MAQIRDISKRTALYERLSKDDEQQGESNSILNQKQYLEEYAHKNGFVNIQHFTDDGYTGRNFNRPGFQEMLAEIENGKIGTVIVNDELEIRECLVQYGLYCLLQCLSVPLVVNSHDHRDLFFKLCPHTLLSLSFLRHADLLIDTAHYFICCLYAESFCCPSPMLSHFPA